VTVNELPALAALLMHPGIRLPETMKVTFPAVEATTVMFFACRKTNSPPAKEMDAEESARLTLTATLFEELAAR
jgi:hypothetical protein